MWFDRLLQGFIDTFLMVGVSSLIALLAGTPPSALQVLWQPVLLPGATVGRPG